MFVRSWVCPAVEMKDDPLECEVGRNGQDGVDEMNPAGGFAHALRLSDGLPDLRVSKVVKSSKAHDVIEGSVLKFESRAVHNHKPAVQMRTRLSNVVRIDVYPDILASEARPVTACATSDIKQLLVTARIDLLLDQRANPVCR